MHKASVLLLSLFPTQVVPHQRPTHLKISSRGLAFYELKKCTPPVGLPRDTLVPAAFPADKVKGPKTSPSHMLTVTWFLCTFHGFITQPVLLPTQLPGSSSLSPPIQNVPHLPTVPAPQAPTTSSLILIIFPCMPRPEYSAIWKLLPYPTAASQLSEMALGGSLGRTGVSADQEMEVQGSSQRHLTGRSSSLD